MNLRLITTVVGIGSCFVAELPGNTTLTSLMPGTRHPQSITTTNPLVDKEHANGVL
jgi:hypothetical protein